MFQRSVHAPGRVALLLGLAVAARAQEPGAFHPGEIWRDDQGVAINAHGGGVLRHQGVYYWFGEHKVAGPAGNKAQVGVHVYSSQDLYDWKDEGIALSVSEDPSNDIARGCILERPKVVFNRRTGKFVMWFHLELKNHGYNSARSGVATADRATGPYRYLGSMRPNAGVWPENLPPERRKPLSAEERAQLAKYGFSGGPPGGPAFPDDLVCRRDFQGGQMARDMTLFEDDDGKVYHIYASEENATLQISELDDEGTACAGRYARILPGKFNEAPAMFKKDGRYFLFTSGTTGWAPNPCRSFTAASIWGPWEPLGNPCRGTEAQTKTTFQSQSTWVLPVSGSGGLIFMADRWQPRNAIDGRYVWLPVRFEQGLPVLEWRDSWKLDALEGAGRRAAP